MRAFVRSLDKKRGIAKASVIGDRAYVWLSSSISFEKLNQIASRYNYDIVKKASTYIVNNNKGKLVAILHDLSKIEFPQNFHENRDSIDFLEAIINK